MGLYGTRDNKSLYEDKGIVTAGNLDICGTTVWKINFPFKVKIDKVITVVTIALSANITTLTLNNHAGTAMAPTIEIGSAAALGVVDSGIPTTNNEIGADEDLQIVSDGACSTGKINVQVHYTRKG